MTTTGAVWAPLGRMDLSRFFGFSESSKAKIRYEGEAFLACRHCSDSATSHVATAELLVKTLRDLSVSDYVTLISIFGYVGSQGLPDVISAWFEIEKDTPGKRYCYPAADYVLREEGYIESWFTFEGDGNTLWALLRESSRIAWGMGLAVGGVQVAERSVSRAIRGSPFELHGMRRIPGSLRFAFKVNDDFTEISVFVSQRIRAEVAAIFSPENPDRDS